MIDGTIKIPVTVAMVRALALQADPGLSWPEWLMPGAMAFIAYNKGEVVTCTDCGGTQKLALVKGGYADCDCEDGQEWQSKWVCEKKPVRLLVGVKVFSGTTAEVQFALDDMSYMLSSIPLSDLFPTLDDAKNAVRTRNGKAIAALLAAPEAT